jgi:hypothetical protein
MPFALYRNSPNSCALVDTHVSNLAFHFLSVSLWFPEFLCVKLRTLAIANGKARARETRRAVASKALTGLIGHSQHALDGTHSPRRALCGAGLLGLWWAERLFVDMPLQERRKAC